MKTRLQAAKSATELRGRYSYQTGIQGFKSIWHQDGFRGYWRGIGGAVPRVALGSTTQIVSYDYFKYLIVKQNLLQEHSVACHFVASLLSGVINVTAMNPFDVISVRLYNQPSNTIKLYTGPIDCFVKTIKTEGPRGLLKGWVAQYFRLGPHTVLTFLFLEQFRIQYNNLS